MTANAKAVGQDAAGGLSHTSDGLRPGAGNGGKATAKPASVKQEASGRFNQ